MKLSIETCLEHYRETEIHEKEVLLQSHDIKLNPADRVL